MPNCVLPDVGDPCQTESFISASLPTCSYKVLPDGTLMESQFESEDQSVSQSDNLIEDSVADIEASIEGTFQQDTNSSNQAFHVKHPAMNKSNTSNNTSNDVSILRVSRNDAKKKKKDETLECLVNSCTAVGQHLQSFLSKESKKDETDLNKADYNFLLSMLQSMADLPENVKLRLKASFLVQIADEFEKINTNSINEN